MTSKAPAEMYHTIFVGTPISERASAPITVHTSVNIDLRFNFYSNSVTHVADSGHVCASLFVAPPKQAELEMLIIRVGELFSDPSNIPPGNHEIRKPLSLSLTSGKGDYTVRLASEIYSGIQGMGNNTAWIEVVDPWIGFVVDSGKPFYGAYFADMPTPPPNQQYYYVHNGGPVSDKWVFRYE